MAHSGRQDDAQHWLLFRGHELLVDEQTLAFPVADPSLPQWLGADPLQAHVFSHASHPSARTLSVAADTEAPPGYRFQSLRSLLTRLPAPAFEVAATASQILEWERSHRFCSRCGTATVAHPRGERARVCPACDFHQYPRINPCVIVCITRDDHILLAQARRHTRPMYSLLAGFVEAGESLEQAAAREVAEESGVRIRDLRYVGSQSWPFPNNLMLAFRAEWASGDIVIQEEELEDAQFFHYRQLPPIPPPGSIAYLLIQSALDELQAKFG